MKKAIHLKVGDRFRYYGTVYTIAAHRLDNEGHAVIKTTSGWTVCFGPAVELEAAP